MAPKTLLVFDDATVSSSQSDTGPACPVAHTPTYLGTR